MASTVLYKGMLNAELINYMIVDMGLPDITKSTGTAWLKSISGKPESSAATAHIKHTDSTGYYTTPNPLADSVGTANNTTAFQSDYGVIFGLTGFTGSEAAITGTTPSVNSYVKMKLPTDGALSLYLNPNRADVEVYVSQTQYPDGLYIESIHSGNSGINLDNAFSFYAYFDNKGGCYFFCTIEGDSKQVQLGRFDKVSRKFIKIGDLQVNKRYYLTDSIAFAEGVVKDAAGALAEGRLIAAFNRVTLNNIGTAISGVDGKYKMPLSASQGDSLFFVCLDDDAPPDFEAQIVDRVVIV